jgi:hypothetical protein
MYLYINVTWLIVVSSIATANMFEHFAIKEYATNIMDLFISVDITSF